MKRIALLIISCLLIISSLTSCLIIREYKNYEIAADTVASIEIYDLSKTNATYGHFVKTETPVYKIPTEKVAVFLSDLAKIRFTDTIIITIAAVDPSFSYDIWTVRVNYTNGSYELISCDGYGETFDQNGEQIRYHHYGCDNDEWWAFIQKHVPEDIFKRPYETTNIAPES